MVSEKFKSKMRGGKEGEVVPKGYRTFQIENMNPEQRAILEQRIAEIGPDSFLARLAAGDEELLAELEAPALRQFSELQGGIASRFSGMGTGGRKSSGFQNTMTSAASNFAQDLQSQRLGLRNQAIKDLHGMSHDLINERPYERGFVEKEQRRPSGFQSAIPGIIQGAGTVVGGMFGGPAGAAAGSAAGSAVGNYASQGLSRGYEGDTSMGRQLVRGS